MMLVNWDLLFFRMFTAAARMIAFTSRLCLLHVLSMYSLYITYHSLRHRMANCIQLYLWLFWFRFWNASQDIVLRPSFPKGFFQCWYYITFTICWVLSRRTPLLYCLAVSKPDFDASRFMFFWGESHIEELIPGRTLSCVGASDPVVVSVSSANLSPFWKWSQHLIPRNGTLIVRVQSWDQIVVKLSRLWVVIIIIINIIINTIIISYSDM